MLAPPPAPTAEELEVAVTLEAEEAPPTPLPEVVTEVVLVEEAGVVSAASEHATAHTIVAKEGMIRRKVRSMVMVGLLQVKTRHGANAPSI